MRIRRIALLAGCLLVLHPGRADAASLHRVEIAESVWAVALLYRVPLELLLRANEMQHPHHHLAYGRRLIIPHYIAGALESPYRHPRMMPPPPPPVPPPAVLPPPRTLAAAAPSSRGVRWGTSLIAAAFRHLGVPYRWGGASPDGFDCSGFIRFVFGAAGVDVPRTTIAMWQEGAAVQREEMRVGDILFFATTSSGPSHAGIYVGRGLMVHAASGFGRVRVTSLDYPYYRQRYLGARRF